MVYISIAEGRVLCLYSSVILRPTINSVYGCNVSSTSYHGSSSCIASAGKEEELHITSDRRERQIVRHEVFG